MKNSLAKQGEFLMIRAVHNGNKSRFAKILDRQFRLRHEIFVKGRGWSEFEVDGVYEKDPYDNGCAAYIISVDEMENVAGGFRLYPDDLTSYAVRAISGTCGSKYSTTTRFAGIDALRDAENRAPQLALL